MYKASDNAAAPPEASISDICSVLSDTDCVKMIKMISEHREPKISDFGSRKRYYERMTKLKTAHLITKKRNKEYQTKGETSHELTALGSTMYESLLTLRRAANLRWNLKALDALNRLPSEERKKLIEVLIHDDAIRKILLEK